MPDHVGDLNGVAYPQACYALNPDDGNHFMIIGDWGGMCGYGPDNDCSATGGKPYPMPNLGSRGDVVGIDSPVDGVAAQQLVATNMDIIASQNAPEFVMNVGDNFYPGSIIEHCDGLGSSVDTHTIPQQFQSTFEDVYNSAHMANKEWMSVLGNHDYGGVCVQMGWPQQVFYTWNQVSKRWVMPAQYYSRNIRFSKNGDDWSDEDYTIDVFFLDSNHADVGTQDMDHDMCAIEGNTGIDKVGGYCEPYLGGTCNGTQLWGDAATCDNYFSTLWADQMTWLADGLDKSTADWQFIVTHFPAYHPRLVELVPLVEQYGVDFVMVGHSHQQQVNYGQPAAPRTNPYGPETAWVISGGGGGVTGDGLPLENGDDSIYGFMDVKITKDKFTIFPYSHGQVDGAPLLRPPAGGTEVTPRARSPPSSGQKSVTV